MHLDMVSRRPETTSKRPPLLFVHGSFSDARVWDEYFLPYFAENGYEAHAVSLRGHGQSEGRERLPIWRLADYVADVAQAVAAVGRPPVLVGHSMGAMVVQKYLERGSAPAAAFLCPVPPTGLLPASFALAFAKPALFAELNTMATGGRPSPAALRDALFSGPLDEATLARHYARMQGESRRALMDMSGWGLPMRWRMDLPESLVVAAERDVLIPLAQVKLGAHHLGAEFRMLPGMGHAVMLEEGWADAAAVLLDWLSGLGL